MRIGEFRDLLDRALPKNKKVLGVGPAGIGKTQVPTDWAKQQGWDCHALCMPLLSPVFLQGYPFRDGDTATHLAFGVLGKCLRATKPTLLILDELGGATGETAKSALRFLQFREIGDKVLPECVRILALSNDVGHGADVSGIIEPLKDRFDTIVNVVPNIDDTVGFGLANGWPADLLAYLRNDADALHDLKPLKSMQRSGATPRGWQMVAEWINDGFDDPEVIAGAVGKGRATAYLAYRQLINKLPDIAQILMDPTGSPIPDDPSAKWLVSMTLAQKMNAQNFGTINKYVTRMSGLFEAFCIQDAFRCETEKKKAGNLPDNWKALTSSRDYTAWACSERGKAIQQSR